MAAAGVIATLLPAAAFFLKLGRFAPARMLIERGVPVALATDINPGGGFTPSMPFVMPLACFGMGLTLEEALVAATVNAAAALGRHDRVGSLEAGKQLDAVILDGPLADLVRVGAPVRARWSIKRGAVVAGSCGDRIASMIAAARPARCTELLDRVAAPEPTPGGGSVSAIAGAFGAALAQMVAGLPRTRHDTDDERAALATLHAPLADLRERLVALADEDTAAFDRLMAAFRLPKASDEDKTARRAAIQAATRDATTVPLQTAVACARVLDLVGTVAALGNPSASSDLLVAMGMLRAGGRGRRGQRADQPRRPGRRGLHGDASARIAAVLDEVATHTHAATAALQG